MRRLLTYFIAVGLFVTGNLPGAFAALTAEQIKQLPPPAKHAVNFNVEIKPIFEASCINCHGHGREKGGFKLDTRDTLLKGGDSGPAVIAGKSAESYLIELVQGFDADNVMPKKGTKLTPEQIGLLRAWIDQGAKWDADITFARSEPLNLKPQRPAVPAGAKNANPVDRFLKPYFAAHHFKTPELVNDRLFARRAYLDVTGLIPTPEQLAAFEHDHQRNKRERLIAQLLADNPDYAQNWISFWNDALRNDYRGTGFIDGGRKQITGWLYAALATNMNYTQFVSQLIAPSGDSEGFTKGIVWRGAVNASQTPQMQAAQNISQVFMGVNLKCASCHDSFINDLTLANAYGLAGIYADGPLEMVRCDKPTGQKAALQFFYPELGTMQPETNRTVRLQEFASLLCERQDGRITRTLVNRIWEKFMGRGLVEPVDDMEKAAWNPDLLDWLAEDFADHNYDVKHLIAQIMTSRAYQLPAVSQDEKSSSEYVFHGPFVRRMSAEQFRDAVAEVTGDWYKQPDAKVDLSLGTVAKTVTAPFAAKWIWSKAGAETSAEAGTNYFRKTVVLEKLPEVAVAFATADNSFTLYVNGKKVGKGDNFAQLNAIDIRKQLRVGTNVIAAEAVNSGTTASPAGFFLYACLRDLSDVAPKQYDFGSDASWLALTNEVAGWEKGKTKSRDPWEPAVALGGPEMAPWKIETQFQTAIATPEYFGKIRSALVNADALQIALGRPNREQVVTTRQSAATTLQALALTNGKELDVALAEGATNMLGTNEVKGVAAVNLVYIKTLGRKPTQAEQNLAVEMVGPTAHVAGMQDLLWSLTMLPEFQLIY